MEWFRSNTARPVRELVQVKEEKEVKRPRKGAYKSLAEEMAVDETARVVGVEPHHLEPMCLQ